jgi:hypothetical protein
MLLREPKDAMHSSMEYFSLLIGIEDWLFPDLGMIERVQTLNRLATGSTVLILRESERLVLTSGTEIGVPAGIATHVDRSLETNDANVLRLGGRTRLGRGEAVFNMLVGCGCIKFSLANWTVSQCLVAV